MQEIADAQKAWNDAMQSQATQNKYTAGIQRYKGNPMAEAAKKLPKFLRKVTEAVESGKMEDKLLSVDPNLWRTNATTVGAARLKSGATKGKPKMDAHLANWIPFVVGVKDQIRAMPDVTDDDAKARMDRNYELLKGYRPPAGRRYT